MIRKLGNRRGRRPTLVTFHAHPDDEAIFTAGLVREAVLDGWRAVLVVATSGEEGEAPAGGGDTGAVRREETRRSAALLGYEEVHFLGYRDSGVPGSPANTAYGAFAAASVDEAARRLAPLLQGADILTIYDPGGIYGHPDHVQVHRVGAAAAGLARVAEVWEATVDRVALFRIREGLVRSGRLSAEAWPYDLLDTLGVEDSGIITLDVASHADLKQTAIAAHSSQVLEAATFMGIPAGAFHRLLATEWYRRAVA
jgi:LmbE family N-acetylglucosaminyl deacetylase